MTSTKGLKEVIAEMCQLALDSGITETPPTVEVSGEGDRASIEWTWELGKVDSRGRIVCPGDHCRLLIGVDHERPRSITLTDEGEWEAAYIGFNFFLHQPNHRNLEATQGLMVFYSKALRFANRLQYDYSRESYRRLLRTTAQIAEDASARKGFRQTLVADAIGHSLDPNHDPCEVVVDALFAELPVGLPVNSGSYEVTRIEDVDGNVVGLVRRES